MVVLLPSPTPGLVNGLGEQHVLLLVESEAANRPAEARRVRREETELVDVRLGLRVPVRAGVSIQSGGHLAGEVDAVGGAGGLLVLELAIAAQELEIDGAEVEVDLTAEAP